MAIIGCKPPGRFTEQHDVFFGIGSSMKALVPDMLRFWPEAKGRIHVDAWRCVSQVEGRSITVLPAHGVVEAERQAARKLFFINLGGYKPGEFEEYHYKMLALGTDSGAAVRKARQTAFYKHYGFAGAEAHVDDKYGIDVDDVYAIQDILDPFYRQQYRIGISEARQPLPEDALHIGYFRLDKL